MEQGSISGLFHTHLSKVEKDEQVGLDLMI